MLITADHTIAPILNASKSVAEFVFDRDAVVQLYQKLKQLTQVLQGYDCAMPNVVADEQIPTEQPQIMIDAIRCYSSPRCNQISG